jgi:hypothetical protein
VKCASTDEAMDAFGGEFVAVASGRELVDVAAGSAAAVAIEE